MFSVNRLMGKTLQPIPRQRDNSMPTAEMRLASAGFLDKVWKPRSQGEVTDQSGRMGSSEDTGPLRSWEEYQAVQGRGTGLEAGWTGSLAPLSLSCMHPSFRAFKINVFNS